MVVGFVSSTFAARSFNSTQSRFSGLIRKKVISFHSLALSSRLLKEIAAMGEPRCFLTSVCVRISFSYSSCSHLSSFDTLSSNSKPHIVLEMSDNVIDIFMFKIHIFNDNQFSAARVISGHRQMDRQAQMVKLCVFLQLLFESGKYILHKMHVQLVNDRCIVRVCFIYFRKLYIASSKNEFPQYFSFCLQFSDYLSACHHFFLLINLSKT
jgi:hypothetical protein